MTNDFQRPAFSVRILRRWGMTVDQLAEQSLPEMPSESLTQSEVSDLICLFRTFGRPDPVALRSRWHTYEALRISASQGVNFDQIRVDQLAFLLQEYDADAAYLSKIAKENEEMHRIWVSLPEFFEKAIPPDIDEERSWLAQAVSRSLRGISDASSLSEQEIYLELGGRLFSILAQEFESRIRPQSARNAETEDTWLTRYSPLMAWAEVVELEAVFRDWVAPGWEPASALRGGLSLGFGPPLVEQYDTSFEALRQAEAITREEAMTRFLSIVQAFEHERGRSVPRLVDQSVLDDEGAIWTWLDLLSLAACESRNDRIQALLNGESDWLDFDAPGEGELPLHLYRALRLAGDSHEIVGEFLSPYLGEEAGEWLDEREEEEIGRAHV